MLLDFSKPQKVAVGGGFDGAHTDGGYMPQMSDVDAHRWKAKKFNIGKDDARIELRKSFKPNSTQVFIIVARDGWNLSKKNEYRDKPNPDNHWFHVETTGLNVRMSMNGPLLLDFSTWDEINQIVQEAKNYLMVNANE